ncbi:hypothetical protein A2U01_0006374 [Trifolium medium]|uniref:Uncharacterized protein n=1 Tax=Trifolium medium TaxID=97028 RepID=A0A392MFJ7_9FABA|nr:hypothetical protein [Trifolium medium]
MQCDSLDESPGESIKTVFVSSDEHKVRNINPSEFMKEITPQNFLKSDLDELYTSLEVDKSLEIFACECGVCNICREISAAILGLPYVLAIPPKPPDFLLISRFSCYLLFPVSCIRSPERPPPKPPDMEATIPP